MQSRHEANEFQITGRIAIVKLDFSEIIERLLTLPCPIMPTPVAAEAKNTKNNVPQQPKYPCPKCAKPYNYKNWVDYFCFH